MPFISSTPRHCPGFDDKKSLQLFVCRCNNCSHPREIFSDEFDRPHTCANCGKPIDFTQCTLDGEGGASSPE